MRIGKLSNKSEKWKVQRYVRFIWCWLYICWSQIAEHKKKECHPKSCTYAFLHFIFTTEEQNKYGKRMFFDNKIRKFGISLQMIHNAQSEEWKTSWNIVTFVEQWKEFF